LVFFLSLQKYKNIDFLKLYFNELMHNTLKKEIQDLANQLAHTVSIDNSEQLLQVSRNLYEKIIILNHQTEQTAPKTPQETVAESVPESPKAEISSEPVETPERELTVQERIQQIMATAKKNETKIAIKPEEKPETIEKENISELKEPFVPVEKPVGVFDKEIEKIESIKNEIKISKPTPSQQESVLKSTLEREFKDAISADMAANMFEKAEKKVITKQSLNDRLSQSQIQIGLNDRIAFVKHLFNNSQSDFNRVLSQLNSFDNEEEALRFINSTVMPEYKWAEDSEYVERLINLVSRKF